MLFLLSFLVLTLTYIVVFVVLDAVRLVVRGALGKGPALGFKAAIVVAAGSLFDKPDEDSEPIEPRINKANNKRWYYLVMMTVITGFIAASNPGSPVLVNSVKELPKEVFSQETRDKTGTGMDVFLHGPTKAKKMDEEAKAEEAKKRAAQRWWKFGSSEPSTKGWSWLTFFLIYFACVPPYAVIAFWDECKAGFAGAYEKFQEHREKMAAASKTGDSKGDGGKPHLGILDVISWSVIMDLVVEFASKFVAHRTAGGRS